MTKHTNTSIQVTMGKPQAHIPPAMKPRGGATHWQKVADSAKAHPGLWCPFQFSGLELVTARKAVTKIKEGLIRAFQDGYFEAALRGETLWVRYNGTPTDPFDEWELISQ